MTEFRSPLSGMGAGLVAPDGKTTHDPLHSGTASPPAQKPRESSTTMLANQILKALDGRSGWTPAGVLREAVNPTNRDHYNQAIQKLRQQKLIESFGTTHRTMYRLAASMKPGSAKAAPPPVPADPTPEPTTEAAPNAAAEATDIAANPVQPACMQIELLEVEAEIQLMAALDQVTNRIAHSRSLEPLAIERATAWLASKYRGAA